jgi:hypothetical protein
MAKHLSRAATQRVVRVDAPDPLPGRLTWFEMRWAAGDLFDDAAHLR